MKIVYIAEKEELQALIKESIHEEIQSFLKGLNQKTIPERMNLTEAAQYLGMTKSGMYKFTHERRIPYHKLGKRVFFYTKDIDEWLKEQSPRIKSRQELEREAASYIMKSKRRW